MTLLKYQPNWKTPLGALALATVAIFSSQARAELVYEESAPMTAPAAAEVRSEDRQSLRGALQASEKQQATDQRATAPVVQVQNTNTVQAEAHSASNAETQNFSKAEMMRRERVRAEVQNEDILQERLEELRLRDEKHRTEELLGNRATTETAVVTTTPVQTQVVGAAVVAAPAPTVTVATTSAREGNVGVSEANLEDELDHPTRIIVSPRAGVASMSSAPGFNVSQGFAGGIGLALEIADHLDLETSYTYAQYGLSPNYGMPMNGGNWDLLSDKQNTFDAGLKLNLTDRFARARPYMDGGLGYGKSFVNLSNNNLQQYGYYGSNYGGANSPDYELSQYLGYLGGGLDVRLSRTILLGGQFRYYKVLSNNENYNPFQYYAANTPQGAAGYSLMNSNYYSVLGSVSVVF